MLLALILADVLNAGESVSQGEAKVIAIITGFTGIMAAVGGTYMTMRKIKTREQKAAHEQVKQMEGYLDEERSRRLEVEKDLFDANLLLAQNGIAPPKRITVDGDHPPNPP